MKKIILLLASIFIFTACSLDDSGKHYSLELSPIVSVDIPTEFTLGQTYPITVHYSKPTTCHYFNTLYYEKNLNIRTIAVENAVLQSNDCQDLTGSDAIDSYTFNFYVTNNGSYIFKFYQGKDDTGNDLFLQYEIPVN